MSWQANVLIEGCTSGPVLRFDAPISFWGGIDPMTSEVTLAGHPQLGCKIADTVLVVPNLIGSSSSSAVLLELLYRKAAPRALILGSSDAILPIGVIVADQMQWPTIPVLMLREPPFQTGDTVAIETHGAIRVVNQTS